MTNRPLRVFLCHSSTDKPAVRELYQKLRAEPWIQPWLDEEELYPGDDWDLAIEKAVEKSDVVLVCLSNGSINKRGYVQKELRFALDIALEMPEETIFIVPLRLEECTPPRSLRDWQYADYFEGQRERALQRLLVSLKRRSDSLELSAPSVVKEIDKETEKFWSETHNKTSNPKLSEQLGNQKNLVHPSQPKIVGIDLGIKNSSIAYFSDQGELLMIPSSENETSTPSIIAVSRGNKILVGADALKQPSQNIIFSAMRLVGCKYDDEGVQRILKRFPYQQFTKASNGDVRAICNGQELALEEIIAAILSKLKKDAENYFEFPVSQAVVAVPVFFNEIQRKAIKDASAIAGLEIIRLVNDTSAVLLAYDFDSKINETVAIYKLGAGVCSFSILEVGEGVCEVKSSSGDLFLGGDDFDQRIINYLVETFQKDNDIDLCQYADSYHRLRLAAESAKIDLSEEAQTHINLPYIIADSSRPVHLAINLTREKFENITSDLIDRILAPVESALADSRLKANNIDKVVMVGGMTHMPAIQRKVAQFFGKEPYFNTNSNTFIATGSAILAGVFNGEIKDILLLDVITHSLGIETLGGVMTTMIERNTTIPTIKVDTFSTASDNQSAVDIHILQGERPMVSDNISLGRFRLDNIPPASKGVPQIEVKYQIDANGLLMVTARDKDTNREQKITAVSSSGLTKSEVEFFQKKASNI
jgi:molecular chaperone DnaK